MASLTDGEFMVDSEAKRLLRLPLIEQVLVQRGKGVLHDSQEFEAIGRNAARVAHDVNNALLLVLAYTSVLLGQLKDQGPIRDDLEEIARVGTLAAKLVGRLLPYRGNGVGKADPLELNAALEEMRGRLSLVLGPHVRLLITLSPRLGCVRIDSSQLEAAIINLALNARDAMPKGGRFTVETATAMLGNALATPQVMLAVSDTGEGMTADVRAQIFEEFFTTKEKGTGLGLSSVREIVEGSGGAIGVESEQGKGTRFTMQWPAVGLPE
jgi:two-component system cell cycle sensor histidine kinase/response regulator CckA